MGILIQFIWVPAHVGVVGNEKVDVLAKQSLKLKQIDLQVPLSKAEAKVFIRKYAQSVWQVHWDGIETGRH